jgi:hypothetical protein
LEVHQTEPVFPGPGQQKSKHTQAPESPRRHQNDSENFGLSRHRYVERAVKGAKRQDDPAAYGEKGRPVHNSLQPNQQCFHLVSPANGSILRHQMASMGRGFENNHNDHGDRQTSWPSGVLSAEFLAGDPPKTKTLGAISESSFYRSKAAYLAGVNFS